METPVAAAGARKIATVHIAANPIHTKEANEDPWDIVCAASIATGRSKSAAGRNGSCLVKGHQYSVEGYGKMFCTAKSLSQSLWQRLAIRSETGDT